MNTVNTFAVDYRQYIDSQGKVVQPLPAFARDLDELIKLYRLMTLIRLFDAKAIALQRTGVIGTYPSILGQEAISVAVGSAMHTEDLFCPAYREYGALIQRGVKLSTLLAYWGGDERGNQVNNTLNFPFCLSVASQCLHAVGVATAFKLRRQARVVVAVLGDGGTSKGDFYEALNLAGVWKLPVVFVINNNQWAISLPRQRQTAAQTLAQKAIAAGFTGVQVDGNDVVAMRDVVSTALLKARQKGGPTLIEALSYRLCDHTTADDASRYHDPEAFALAWQQEPLMRLRHYLTQRGVWSTPHEAALKTNLHRVVTQAVAEYTNQTAPLPTSMFDDLYATLPLSLQAQRDDLLEHSQDGRDNLSRGH